MEELAKYDKQTILEKSIFAEIFDQEDEIDRAYMIQSLETRAKELGVLTSFRNLLRVHQKALKEMQKERERKEREKRQQALVENMTNFSDSPHGNMYCGSWIASDDGIFTRSNDFSNEIRACYHPILPVERLKNLETGEENIKIAFKREPYWESRIVSRELLKSASKIVSLSRFGIDVSSETAKLLVHYLTDVELLNSDVIKVNKSTGKLGYTDKHFLPYDKTIQFDREQEFKELYNSIKEHGVYELWREHVLKLRQRRKIEVQMLLAASFASVLVGKLGALPFFVDLWGETENGKTVALMLATSVWADPAPGKFMGDFQTTDVALETKANVLNNLPMILDDSSKMTESKKLDIENFIYTMCSGKGKSRSNRELGIRRESTWSLVAICNGERPLSGYAGQGGALNRILEIEGTGKIFENPQETANIIRNNYGGAGMRFINLLHVLEEQGVDICAIQKDFYNKIVETSEVMSKQAMALSAVLTADKLVADYMMQDGVYIDIDEAIKLLASYEHVSENQRVYNDIIDRCRMSEIKFDEKYPERWGKIDTKEGYYVLFPVKLQELCTQCSGNKSTYKSFLSWGVAKGIIPTTKDGKPQMPVKLGEKVSRMIKVSFPPEEDEEGNKKDGWFENVTSDEQLKIPF